MADTSCVVRYPGSLVMDRHTNDFRPRHIQRPKETSCTHTQTKENVRMSEVKYIKNK